MVSLLLEGEFFHASLKFSRAGWPSPSPACSLALGSLLTRPAQPWLALLGSSQCWLQMDAGPRYTTPGVMDLPLAVLHLHPPSLVILLFQ